MTIYILHTNEGIKYITSTPKRLRERIWEYIREKKAAGYPLADIVFCWSPITVGRL